MNVEFDFNFGRTTNGSNSLKNETGREKYIIMGLFSWFLVSTLFMLLSQYLNTFHKLTCGKCSGHSSLSGRLKV
jgi:hypothetical protein